MKLKNEMISFDSNLMKNKLKTLFMEKHSISLSEVLEQFDDHECFNVYDTLETFVSSGSYYVDLIENDDTCTPVYKRIS